MKQNTRNLFYSKLKQQNVNVRMFNESVAKTVEDTEMVEENEQLTSFPENIFSNKIGTHPDFINEDDLPKNQYICCMFMDISSSTELALKYSLSNVQKIKNAILSTGIEIIRRFGGHVHRLQGDAIFALIGHQNLRKSDAIVQALNTSAVIQHFNESFLKDFFENDLEVEPPSIRIGIDFGDEEEVLWADFGIEDINEVTVTSLHADLASKLQHEAPKNGIMIGENVFGYLQLSDFVVSNKKYIKHGEHTEDYYILSKNNFNYKMKVFDWREHLQRISHYEYLGSNNPIKRADISYIECKVFNNVNDPCKEKYLSDKTIPKDMDLEYKLIVPHYQRKNIKSIQWKVHNFGNEAKEDNCDDPYIVEEAENNFICNRTTKYNGLHYMECMITTNKATESYFFSLYVNDDDKSSNYLKKVDREIGN